MQLAEAAEPATIDLTGRLRRPIGSRDECENKSAYTRRALVFIIVVTPKPGEAGRSDRRRLASLRDLRGLYVRARCLTVLPLSSLLGDA